MEAQPDDGAVFARSVAEPELFTVIFDRHYRSVYGYLSRRVGRVIADDLAAETFILAFERRSSYDPRTERALPWLLGIAVNLIAHHRRSEARQFRALASAASLEPRDETPFEQSRFASSERLVSGLEQLDDYDREALLLYAWGDLKYAEIAQALGIPIGTVRSRISRARAKLRSALDSPGENVVAFRRQGAQSA
jgi:RNA polymerase sigma-70 factor (ECF subfamily)